MRVLVATGASGGHIFPAISFISALKEQAKEIDALLVLPQRSLKAGILPKGYKTKYISTSTLTLGINSRNLIALSKFFKGLWEGLRIVLEFKPDLVVGFGSLDSIPCLFFAWLFRIKTLIHEQNVLPGRANRLLAKLVDRVAVSFDKTKLYLNINQERIVVTGNPLRRELVIIDKTAGLDYLGLDKDKFTILVMGGSQGSQRINLAFLDALLRLTDYTLFQVIHICGKRDYDATKDKYKNFPLRVKVFSFLEQMQYAYSVSDLAVCRAGATTIAELIYFNLPAIIIPYPFAYAHQYNNAKELEERKSAVIINDKDLETDSFKELLCALINNPLKAGIMRSNYGYVSGNCAARQLAELAVSLA